MDWLLSLDIGLFRFINSTLQNPVFDVVMPFASGNAVFFPFLVLAGLWVLWKGDRHARIWLILMLLILPLGDSYVCNSIKHSMGRLRPYMALENVHLLVGAGRNNSMPSSHSANWACATVITFIFFRRSWRYLLPVAFLVSISRIYNGVHYPSDVLAGWVLGATYGFVGVVGLNSLWAWGGRKWFPHWWEKCPSLIRHNEIVAQSRFSRVVSEDQQWLHLGYVLIGVLLLARLLYINTGIIELSEDEAYQWVWSKHPALGYYSKPPMIAYAQWVGTHLWGDNLFGVRFFSPVIAAVIGLWLLRFFAQNISARLGFFFVVITTATPVLAVGATLMTVDPLSVLFWTAAMLSGWRAIQENSRTQDWLWTGLWMGLGFLSKYTALFQWASWACVFALIPKARKQLRRPGPYLALVVNLLCFTPVIVWNAQHGWISLVHTAERGNLGDSWHPTLRFVRDFLLQELFLFNPVFFVAIIWAAITWWRRRRENPLLTYFVCMGAPVFLGYLLWSFHSRVLPNWIAPSVIPLLAVMTIYWYDRWRDGGRKVTLWLKIGVGLGLVVVVLLHDSSLIKRIAGAPLPPNLDESRRLQGWKVTAETVDRARQQLLKEGKPVFIIGSHYGISGQMAFNLPEARVVVATDLPLVYCLTSDRPRNQFYFWPGYRGARTGQNAIYVSLVSGRAQDDPPPPDQLLQEFDSVKSLGIVDISKNNRLVRRIQIIECRGLR